MITTLTLNPCVDLNLEVEAFSFTEPLRALTERRRPAGKGINVAAVLKLLGATPIAVALLGGSTGREFMAMARETIDFPLRIISAEAETRTNIVITSRKDGRHLKVNQKGGEATVEELRQVALTLHELLGPGDVAVLAGSLPPGLPTDTYAQLLAELRAKGCFTALDADNEPFRNGLRAKPNLIKPNRTELERLFQTKLDSEEAIVESARLLVENECDICAVTDGARPAFLVTNNLCLRGLSPPAYGSPVGAGDAFLAGMVRALSDHMMATQGGELSASRVPRGGLEGANPQSASISFSFPESVLRDAFRLALACGSSSASTPDTNYFTPEILSETLQQVGIETV